MKRIARFARIAIIVSLVLGVAIIVGVVLAANVTIEEFTTDDQFGAYLVGGTANRSACDSLTPVTSALGGTRELTLTKVTGGGLSTAALVVDTSRVVLSFQSSPSVDAYGAAIWDGNSNSCSLDTQGLGAVDLTGGGTNDGILAQVTFDDIAGVTMTMKAYTGTNWSQVITQLPGGVLSGQRVDIFAPFSSFTTMGGTGIGGFTSVGAFVLEIDNRGNGAGADVELRILQATAVRDFGDLPDTYSTTLAGNGARHLTATGLRLGGNVDAEATGSPSGTAAGDDSDSTPDDEDGVSRVMSNYWAPSATVNLLVTVNGCSGTCYLNSWMDWNNDGDFDTGEQVYSDYGIGNGTGQNVSLSIPSGYVAGTDVHARFRLCSTTGQCNTYYGSAPNGEVEDYLWGFGPTAVSLDSLQARPTARVSPGVNLYLLLALAFAPAVILGSLRLALAWRRA